MNLSALPSPLDIASFQTSISHLPTSRTLPHLTRESISNGRHKTGDVIRFRGMIQDVFGVELFGEEYLLSSSEETNNDVKGSTRFYDSIPLGAKLVGDKVGERHVFYVVPVPGEGKWIRDEWLERWSEGCGEQMEQQQEEAGCSSWEGNGKRTRASLGMSSPPQVDQESNRVRMMEETGVTPPHRGGGDGSAVTMTANVMTGPNHPISDEVEIPCVLKTYDGLGYDAKSFSLLDVVEIVGVVTIDPHVYNGALPSELAQEEDDRAMLEGHLLVPSSTAPRIHALWCHVIRELIPPPLLATTSVQEARALALRWISAAVGPDALLAEYLLLWSIASVSRRPMNNEVVVGKLSLGLGGCTPQVVRNVEELVKTLFPRVQCIDAAASSELNAQKFWPHKSADFNRLVAGRLQTGEGTKLVIDETKIETGVQVSELGVSNLRALARVSTTQQVTFEFPYFSRDHGVDNPVLVLSKNRLAPAVVPVDAMVCAMEGLPPTSSNLTMTDLWSTVHVVRQYLEMARLRGKSLTLSEAAAQQAELDFVNARRAISTNGTSKVDEADLHLWINTARAVASSWGESTVTLDAYGRARNMDTERRKRLASFSSSSSS